MEQLGNHERIALVEPAGYEDFVWLMNRCYFALSDSGWSAGGSPQVSANRSW